MAEVVHEIVRSLLGKKMHGFAVILSEDKLRDATGRQHALRDLEEALEKAAQELKA